VSDASTAEVLVDRPIDGLVESEDCVYRVVVNVALGARQMFRVGGAGIDDGVLPEIRGKRRGWPATHGRIREMKSGAILIA